MYFPPSLHFSTVPCICLAHVSVSVERSLFLQWNILISLKCTLLDEVNTHDRTQHMCAMRPPIYSTSLSSFWYLPFLLLTLASSFLIYRTAIFWQDLQTTPCFPGLTLQPRLFCASYEGLYLRTAGEDHWNDLQTTQNQVILKNCTHYHIKIKYI